MCLYSGNQILEPVILPASACVGSNATTGCMAKLYNYKDYKYNGPVELLPNLGEITSFVVIDPYDNIDAVMIMNPKSKQTVIKTTLKFSGIAPTGPILLDDFPPDGQDQGYWDPMNNMGELNLTVQPTFTDGVIIGHLNFINHYCMEASYVPRVVGQIEYLTIMSGVFPNINRSIRIPFTSAMLFKYCQYPIVDISKKDITGCPGGSNGYANITVDKLIGPPGNYSYTWKDAAGNVLSTDTGIYNLKAGTYTLVVEINGCDTNRTITILPPRPVVIKNIDFTFAIDGSATATVTMVENGQPPFTYLWTKGTTVLSTTSTASNLVLGEAYNLTVTDSCGVEATKIVWVNCPAGKFLNTALKRCVVCPPGSYSDVPSLSCTRCPPNTYSPGGKTVCIPCAPSEISPAGSAKCIPCPPGQKRNAGELSCTACPAGTARCSGTGCLSCPRGTFSRLGAPVCEPCDPGYFAGALGLTSCRICPIGTYSTGGTSSCTKCPLGTTSTAGANEITACE